MGATSEPLAAVGALRRDAFSQSLRLSSQSAFASTAAAASKFWFQRICNPKLVRSVDPDSGHHQH
jgi:hypothetical protein